MTVSQNARSYLERHGLYPTHRAPQTRVDMRGLLLEQLPLDRVPTGLALEAEGDPAPDRGIAQTYLPPPPASG